LPKDLKPISYEVFIQPFFKLGTKPEYYNASVKIKFKCLSDTNKIVMNMKDLALENSTLSITSSTHANYNSPRNFIWDLDNQTNIFTATFGQSQSFKANNEYTFYAEFRGFLKDDNLGLYRTSYLISNNSRM
jgi:hypothetical protein